MVGGRWVGAEPVSAVVVGGWWSVGWLSVVDCQWFCNAPPRETG